MTAGPFRNYPDACARAATAQGLDPVAAYLRGRGFRVDIEQTGGMCMVAAVYTADRLHRVWITDDEEGTSPARYLAVAYRAYVNLADVDDGESAWDQDEGRVLAEHAELHQLPALIGRALDLWPLPIGPDSWVAVDLEACNPDELPEQVARHPRVSAVCITPAHGCWWDEYRYSGPALAVADWLADAYTNGDGHTGREMLAEQLYSWIRWVA